MSNFDWFAYRDGAMDAETRVQADAFLAENPSMRAKLGNLDDFISDLRRESLSQEIPLARLHALIPETRPSIFARYHRPILAFAGGLALVAVVWIGLSTRTNDPGGQGHIATNDPAQAAQWVAQRTGMDAPVLRFASAELVASESDGTTGCYCLKIDGKIVHLKFFRGAAPANVPTKTENGCDFKACPSCICFAAKGICFSVKATDAIGWKIAREAAAQLIPKYQLGDEPPA